MEIPATAAPHPGALAIESRFLLRWDLGAWGAYFFPLGRVYLEALAFTSGTPRLPSFPFLSLESWPPGAGCFFGGTLDFGDAFLMLGGGTWVPGARAIACPARGCAPSSSPWNFGDREPVAFSMGS